MRRGASFLTKFQALGFNKRLFFDKHPERIVKQGGSIVPSWFAFRVSEKFRFLGESDGSSYSNEKERYVHVVRVQEQPGRLETLCLMWFKA
jgi:hypothetical protein